MRVFVVVLLVFLAFATLPARAQTDCRPIAEVQTTIDRVTSAIKSGDVHGFILQGQKAADFARSSDPPAPVHMVLIVPRGNDIYLVYLMRYGACLTKADTEAEFQQIRKYFGDAI